MAYADYAYYTGVFNGKALDGQEFAKFSELASFYVDRALFGRLGGGETVIDPVKKAVCAISEIWKEEEEQSGMVRTAVKSESVDGDSVSYADPDKLAAFWSKKKAELFNLYLPPSDPLRGRWV